MSLDPVHVDGTNLLAASSAKLSSKTVTFAETVDERKDSTASSSSRGSKKSCSRRSHRKSRNGCDNCKRRRVKCDEQKPRCNNCKRHGSHCSFTNHPIPLRSTAPSVNVATDDEDKNASTTSNSSSLLQAHRSLNVMDLELLHNYDTSTCYTITNIPSLQIYFRNNVPQIGLSHPFVMHIILSISALHLSRFKHSDVQSVYLSQARRHYKTALHAATALMPSFNEQNCPALYIFAALCPLYTLGIGPKPGDFLVVDRHGIPEWLTLFRGANSILDSSGYKLRDNDLSPMVQISERHDIRHTRSVNEHVEQLRRWICSAFAKDDRDLWVYMTTLESLSKSLPTMPLSDHHHEKDDDHDGQGSPQLMGAWLCHVSDEFIVRLQRREPVALVILAHFCVLLKSLGAYWWTRDWVEHLMAEIHASLEGKEYREWIRWPMEEIGWFP